MPCSLTSCEGPMRAALAKVESTLPAKRAYVDMRALRYCLHVCLMYSKNDKKHDHVFQTKIQTQSQLQLCVCSQPRYESSTIAGAAMDRLAPKWQIVKVLTGTCCVQISMLSSNKIVLLWDKIIFNHTIIINLGIFNMRVIYCKLRMMIHGCYHWHIRSTYSICQLPFNCLPFQLPWLWCLVTYEYAIPTQFTTTWRTRCHSCQCINRHTQTRRYSRWHLSYVRTYPDRSCNVSTPPDSNCFCMHSRSHARRLFQIADEWHSS